MIDVTFLLIIFFLVSSHLAKQENNVPLELPETQTGIDSALDRDHPTTTIHVTRDGGFQMGGQSISIEDFRNAIAARHAETAGDCECAFVRIDKFRIPSSPNCFAYAAKQGLPMWSSQCSRSLPRMRTRFHNPRDRTSNETMMTPMIDVVFLVADFFLTTSSFQIVEQWLPGGISDQGKALAGNAPQPPSAEQATDVSDCIVRILTKPGANPAYQYQLNGTVVADARTMIERIRNIVAVRADVPIIVDPDDGVPIGIAIHIYDQARHVGALRIYFAAR